MISGLNSADVTREIIARYPLEGAAIYVGLGISRRAVHQRASKLGVRFIGKRTLSTEARGKISSALTGLYKSDEWRRKLSDSLIGRKHTPERLRAIAKGLERSRAQSKKMTAPEHHVQSLLEFMFGSVNPYEFTGLRKLWIEMPSGRQKNPDFTSRDKKKVIEVFGRYWHRDDDPHELVRRYRDVGWECMVLWEDKMADAVDDIMLFTYPHEFMHEMMEPFECA